MARVKVRYLVAKRVTRADRSQHVVYYWQPAAPLRKKGWQPERLPDDLTHAIARAEDLNRQVDAARARNQATPQPRARAKGPAPHTVKALVNAYKVSRFYRDKAPETRKGYDAQIAVIEHLWGDLAAAQLDAVLVEEAYNIMRQKTPASAAALVRVVRLIWNKSGPLGFRGLVNPAARPGLVSTASKGRLWSPECIAVMAEAAEKIGRPSIGHAIILNAWLGQREGDLLRAPLDALQDGVLRIRQSKTGAGVPLPVGLVPHLAALIAQIIADRPTDGTVTATTLIVSEETGRPYKEDNFRALVRKVRAVAHEKWPDFDGLWFMHLRHTAVTRLFEAGCLEAEIAAITGHSLAAVHQILDRYLIRTERLAANAFKKRLAHEQSLLAGDGV